MLKLFFVLVALVNIAHANEQCRYPTAFKDSYDFNWRSKSGEWANLTAPTDYMMLALSWSPAYCATLSQTAREKEFQCIHSDVYGLIVHGLWPQKAAAPNVRSHPRNCRDEPQLNTTFVKRYFCIMPSETLMQGEWEKHGTCYYNTANDYYSVTEAIFRDIRVPDRKLLETGTATAIKQAFVTLNAPALFDSAIRIDTTSTGSLKEVKLCYSLNFRFTACV